MFVEKVFPEGRTKQIHVHQQRLRAGLPALIVRIGARSRSEYFTKVEIAGAGTVVQPDNPLSCGAKAWIETDSEVKAILDIQDEPDIIDV